MFQVTIECIVSDRFIAMLHRAAERVCNDPDAAVSNATMRLWKMEAKKGFPEFNEFADFERYARGIVVNECWRINARAKVEREKGIAPMTDEVSESAAENDPGLESLELREIIAQWRLILDKKLDEIVEMMMDGYRPADIQHKLCIPERMYRRRKGEIGVSLSQVLDS